MEGRSKTVKSCAINLLLKDIEIISFSGWRFMVQDDDDDTYIIQTMQNSCPNTRKDENVILIGLFVDICK